MFRPLGSKDDQVPVGGLIYRQGAHDPDRPHDYFCYELRVTGRRIPTAAMVKEKKAGSAFLRLLLTDEELARTDSTYDAVVTRTICRYAEKGGRASVKKGERVRLTRQQVLVYTGAAFTETSFGHHLILTPAEYKKHPRSYAGLREGDPRLTIGKFAGDHRLSAPFWSMAVKDKMLHASIGVTPRCGPGYALLFEFPLDSVRAILTEYNGFIWLNPVHHSLPPAEAVWAPDVKGGIRGDRKGSCNPKRPDEVRYG